MGKKRGWSGEKLFVWRKSKTVGGKGTIRQWFLFYLSSSVFDVQPVMWTLNCRQQNCMLKMASSGNQCQPHVNITLDSHCAYARCVLDKYSPCKSDKKSWFRQWFCLLSTGTGFFFLHCCLAVTRSGTHPEIGLRKVLSEADQQLSRGRI